MAATTETSILLRLPDELVEAIVFHLPPDDTLALGGVSRRAYKITSEYLVWRRHCLQEYVYWHPSHEMDERRSAPPARTLWRKLFDQRRRTDAKAQELFDALLLTQQHRIDRLEKIAKFGYDVKDLMQRIRDTTPDDADDVLARRYHARIVLAQIHRHTAVEKWTRLQNQQMVRLEEVLGSYDLFVLGDRKGDLGEIDEELSRLAEEVRASHRTFEDLSAREKSIQAVEYLRGLQLLGNREEDEYHALRNNFISLALYDDPHTSLPLQSVAIYCAVLRRLGVNAKPSNYPHHVHAVIEAPPGFDLDGNEDNADPHAEGYQRDIMHMDPWHSTEEVPRQFLTNRLGQMGAAPEQYGMYLGAASMIEIVMRAGRNVMNSVQEIRNRRRPHGKTSWAPDIESSWYGMLWSMMMLGDASPSLATAMAHRRRQCLPYLLEHMVGHFPEDLGLFDRVVGPMFLNKPEYLSILRHITAQRKGDRDAKPRCTRSSSKELAVRFRVGHHFQHKRYAYAGFIVGWDPQCNQSAEWIAQTRVDELPRGRHQPFYHTIAEDKTTRCVAEENIHLLTIKPSETLLVVAGRYFKRWDDEAHLFVSNIRDEYPDD